MRMMNFERASTPLETALRYRQERGEPIVYLRERHREPQLLSERTYGFISGLIFAALLVVLGAVL